jgi:hypothetical protein
MSLIWIVVTGLISGGISWFFACRIAREAYRHRVIAGYVAAVDPQLAPAAVALLRKEGLLYEQNGLPPAAELLQGRLAELKARG